MFRSNEQQLKRASVLFTLTAPIALLSSCGRGSSSSQPPPPPTTGVTSIVVSPSRANIYTNQTRSFTAQVTGNGAFNNSVVWSVDGIPGGDSTIGSITSTGQFIA